ncbi:MAG: hypothetical protein JXQ75_05170 [Phycisphaerae bacterium]|nr:hypothetical protein [Phycisphaerae bacterium]
MAPAANGKNGRDSGGRFAPGNRFGGNPHGGTVAKLRAVMLKAVPVERLERIVDVLLREAESGNLKAIKLVLSYTIGRPIDINESIRLEESVRQAEAFRTRFGDVFEVE